jgi:hypothetical protein
MRTWTAAGDITCASEARWQQEQLNDRIDAFLRLQGWTHTSSTPGSFWMWRKAFEGVTMYVTQSHALAIELSQGAS